MPQLNMVNKAHGKWLCAAADTYFLVCGGLAALGFKLVFHSHSVIPSATAAGAALTAVFTA